MSLQSVNPRCNFCFSALMSFHCLSIRERGGVGKARGHICRGALSGSPTRMNERQENTPCIRGQDQERLCQHCKDIAPIYRRLAEPQMCLWWGSKPLIERLGKGGWTSQQQSQKSFISENSTGKCFLKCGTWDGFREYPKWTFLQQLFFILGEFWFPISRNGLLRFKFKSQGYFSMLSIWSLYNISHQLYLKKRQMDIKKIVSNSMDGIWILENHK